VGGIYPRHEFDMGGINHEIFGIFFPGFENLIVLHLEAE
jgi:hypothetical protein